MLATYVTVVAALTAALVPGPYRFALEPDPATDRDPIVLRQEVPAGVPAIAPRISARPGLIEVTYEVPDFGAPNLPAQVRRYPVGLMPAGTHRLRLIACGNAPPPLPACAVTAEAPFRVAASGVQAVPATSPGAAALLAGALGLFALVHLRRSTP